MKYLKICQDFLVIWNYYELSFVIFKKILSTPCVALLYALHICIAGLITGLCYIDRRYSDNMVLSQWKCFVKSTKGTDCWGEAKGPCSSGACHWWWPAVNAKERMGTAWSHVDSSLCVHLVVVHGHEARLCLMKSFFCKLLWVLGFFFWTLHVLIFLCWDPQCPSTVNSMPKCFVNKDHCFEPTGW